MKKTYGIAYWIWDKKWEEYERMYMDCGDDELGKITASSLFKTMDVTKDMPQVSIIEYLFDDDDEYVSDETLAIKELVK